MVVYYPFASRDAGSCNDRATRSCQTKSVVPPQFMALSIVKGKDFSFIKQGSFWTSLLCRDNISQLLNCEVYDPFYYTEIIFRSS